MNRPGTVGIRKLMAALLLAAASVLGFSAAATAHNYVVSATPSEGETLTTLPARFEITTNDNLLDVTGSANAFGFDVIDADGLYYGDGCIAVEGATMWTDAALGAAGAYTISYQLVSADGHTVSGEYAFTWAPEQGQPVSQGYETAAKCGVDREPVPTTEPTSEPTDEPTAKPTAEPGAEAPGGVLDEVLWIAGSVAAIVVLVLVAYAVLGRRKTSN